MKITQAIENLKYLASDDCTETQSDYLEELDMAINALEKQKPKKCKLFKDLCDCGKTVYPHMDYCDKCGQALEWHKDTTEKGGVQE